MAVGPVLGYKREVIEVALQAVDDERNEFVSESSCLPDALENTCRAYPDYTITRTITIKGKDRKIKEECDPWLTAVDIVEVGRDRGQHCLNRK
jgi:hypothetical protein